MKIRELNVKSANSSCLVPPASWMWQREVDARWGCWMPFPLYRGVDMHDVVVALLKSIHVAQVDVDSRRRRTKRVWAGKLTLQIQNNKRKTWNTGQCESSILDPNKWQLYRETVQRESWFLNFTEERNIKYNASIQTAKTVYTVCYKWRLYSKILQIHFDGTKIIP